MNTAMLTGWIARSDPAWTPSTAQAAAQKRLVIELMVRQENGQDVPWHCEVTDPRLIEKCEPLATPGRTLIAQAQIVARPFMGAGNVQKGWFRYLSLTHAEFPDRAGVKKSDATAKPENAAS